MRKYLFITMCAFLSLWAGKVSAQRYLPGQTGLELRPVSYTHLTLPTNSRV